MATICKARIISYNQFSEIVCASAARISTTSGTAEYIFQKPHDSAKDRSLIMRVLDSGHESLIEHIVLSISFTNVSAFVEQFFIESRLASFTVKSRRYVNFSNMGYFTPCQLHGDSLSLYHSYMDVAFNAYSDLVNVGIPKEDARFILPYSFFSNFYCTLNARELIHIIKSIYYGRGRSSLELQDIANQLTEQVCELFPFLTNQFTDVELSKDIVTKKCDVPYRDWKCERTKVSEQFCGIPTIIQKPMDSSSIIKTASMFHDDTDFERQRGLEQLSYTFIINDITLSGITHLTRHRVQSLIVPPLEHAYFDRIICPETITNNCDAFDIYISALDSLWIFLHKALNDATLLQNLQYFALSGNTMDVMTTVNARELSHFIRLRSCNRAQWEIRRISIRMLHLLRESSPEVFNVVGPSCYMSGICPEGRMTCGKMPEVIDSFRTLESLL